MKARLIFALAISSMIAASCAGDRLDYVNPFMGSIADNGGLTPGACVPFGLVNVCVDNNPYGGAGYDYSKEEAQYISVTRIPGMKPGEGCGGLFGLKPGYYSDTLLLVKGSEKAHPGYYAGKFSDGTAFELTATKTVAVEKYSLGPDRRLFFTTLSQFSDRGNSAVIEVRDERTLFGLAKSVTAHAAGKYTLFFVLSSDKPFKIVSGDPTYKGLQFDDSEVEVRIALSPISCDYAVEALDSLSAKSFDEVRTAAESSWREKLSRFDVKGGTREQKTLFYTSLYNLYHSPVEVTAEDGCYYGTDNEYHDSDGHRYYSGWNMYDAFRTKFPLLSITDVEEASDIAWSLCALYRSGKKNWATFYESAPSVRSEHAVITILDYLEKGIIAPGTVEEAYADMSADMKVRGKQRKAEERLSGAYDLWAMSRIAGLLGNQDDSVAWSIAADSLFNVTWEDNFRTIDENYLNVDREVLGRDSRAQARWAAPVFNSEEEEFLDRFFADFLYDVGNPDNFSAPFLYDDHSRTSEIIREYLVGDRTIHEYRGGERCAFPVLGRAVNNSPDGFAKGIGELDGTLSAWYLFAQMGFYPKIPGIPEYSLFTPYFTRITMNLGENRNITIKTSRRGKYSKGKPLKSVSVNGDELPEPVIGYDFFREGGTIEFNY
ncbi:MAG: glycoside hydrolase family 92 protein [Bacteroidales bacterium]|nr:glycoside hydrolase family 92 protein [Bacteroidales bacterium]